MAGALRKIDFTVNVQKLYQASEHEESKQGAAYSGHGKDRSETGRFDFSRDRAVGSHQVGSGAMELC